MERNRACVQFQDVQKSYDGERPVVKGLNPDVARGEFLTMDRPAAPGTTAFT